MTSYGSHGEEILYCEMRTSDGDRTSREGDVMEDDRPSGTPRRLSLQARKVRSRAELVLCGRGFQCTRPMFVNARASGAACCELAATYTRILDHHTRVRLVLSALRPCLQC